MLLRLIEFDGFLVSWLTSHRLVWLDPLMLGLSATGRRGFVWLAIGVAFALWKRPLAAGVWRTALAIWLALVCTGNILKPAFDRPRPPDVVAGLQALGDVPESRSFPSGHAASAFAGAFGLTRVWPAASIPLWTLAVLMAVSRVYLGVHYPLDILAGALVGLACAYFALGHARPVDMARPSRTGT